jgi:cytochrome c oxidase subunit 2
MNPLAGIFNAGLASQMGFVERLWFSEPGATFARDVDYLFMFIFWLCTVFFVGLMGAMIYFVIRYRRRPGVPHERSASHNTPLELAWSVGPLLLLAVIFFWGFEEYLELNVAPANAEVIDVTAQKWSWNMEYDNGAQTTETISGMIADKEIPVFAVPVGRPIKLNMISQDVIHSFWVPNFRVKFDVFPFRYTTMWFEATREGDHIVFCAEYCGEQHSQMAAILRAMSPADYQQWKQDNKLDENIAPRDLGKILYVTKACNSCHSVDGSSGTGPTWLDLYGDTAHRVTIDGQATTIEVDENYLRESILVPGAKIVQGYANQMASYQGQLTEKELAGLIAYMKSLSEKGRAELEAGQQGGEESPDGDGEGGGDPGEAGDAAEMSGTMSE